MRYVGFLLNSWKKREQRLFDRRNDAENSLRNYQDGTSHPANASTAAGCTLAVKIERSPLGVSTASPVEGSWSYQPPLPNHDWSTQKRSEGTLVRRDGLRMRRGLEAPYRGDGALSSGSQKQSRTNNTSPQSSTQTSSNRQFNYSPMPTNYDSKDVLVSSTNYPTHLRDCSSASPQQSQMLPSFPLPPPINESASRSLEIRGCQCPQPPKSTHHPYCPKFPDAQKNMYATTASGCLLANHKTVHAVLDLSVDQKPRALYHSTGSTPCLPYNEQAVLCARQESSTCSGESSDTEIFPLSLFPAPPPLLVRKKIPTPLVLRPTLPSSTPSSRDSTLVDTPTAPRFPSLIAPSPSPTKKFPLGRTFSPPPTSPPNSPLPDLPPSRDRSTEKLVYTLRTAQSNADLRGTLPHLATHRLTSSETTAGHSSLPIKRPTKLRLDPARVHDNHTYVDMKEHPVPTTSMDAHVQWGYAL